ncbi:hypothetical protein G7Y89_g8747 [Cudoniella acicularis]|uniref:Enoyl reductase (ER) domain-containing protein n=1 Tax=Cudoniella acicularis TaxID=354080 RepID=A0A8H4W2L0_9HELO|nr:hypothetical protein G7Y89_g8747 [Cudoniella acicularis]
MVQTMAFQQTILFDTITVQALATIILGFITVYTVARCTYLLYFHPLSKYPGPRIAAVSNIWYGYHWLSGRYPWAIDNVLRKYGDVVRIAPNELVFLTPQATIDIFSPNQKGLETWVKTDFNNRGDDLGGIIWEQDPARHHQVLKKIAPGFSKRSMRAMEPLVHQYIDYFVERMQELGNAPEGVGLVQWTNWLAMDLSSELSWNEKMNQMKDLKNSIYLEVLIGFNQYSTVMQVFKRFPLLKPFQYLWVPLAKLNSWATMEKNVDEKVGGRIDRRGKTQHVDFFEYVLPADSPLPTDIRELKQLTSVTVQLMLAGFDPISHWFYGTLFFLLQEPKSLKILVEEIRNAFKSYNDITPESVISLPYLQACLKETLRMLPSNLTGFPRLSPGAMVDGEYIPKGVHVQTSILALGRSPRYFHEPLHYRPHRWLPAEHPLYDDKFAHDDLKGFFFFILGPRRAIAQDRGGKPQIVHSIPVPTLLPGTVIVKTVAVALNPSDYKICAAFPTPGAGVGTDFAGTVVAVADGTGTDLAPGDLVCGVTNSADLETTENGAFAEYVRAPTEFILRVPGPGRATKPGIGISDMDMAKGASLGTALATCTLALWGADALNLPATPDSPQPSNSKTPLPVLVYGGSTATGTTIQLLKLSGLDPITTCSPSNFDLVRSYGATAVFDYSRPDTATNIKEYTGGRLKHVMDCISGKESVECCYAAMARTGGRYASLNQVLMSCWPRGELFMPPL